MHVPIRVILADDHPIVRQGIRNMLSKTKDIEVVDEAANGSEALERVEKHHPDILITDIDMPLMDGLEAARRLRNMHSPVRILILSGYASKAFIQEAIEIGVDGYLVKDDAPFCLPEVIRRIASGEKGLFSKKIGPGE